MDSEKTLSNFGNFMSWFFGIFFILGSITQLKEDPLSSPFFLLAGLYLLPSLNKKIEKIFKISLSGWKKTLVVFLILMIGAVLTATFGENKGISSKNTIQQQDSKMESNKKTGEESKKEEAASNWEYFSSTDKMDGSVTKSAALISSNLLHFAFPYNGGTSFVLVIRNQGGADDAMLTCSKCQFIGAGSYDTESLRIKFDDETPINYGFTRPADYSSDAVFIQNTKGFINKLKTGKVLKIEAPFYNEGRQIIEFNVEGFNWQ